MHLNVFSRKWESVMGRAMPFRGSRFVIGDWPSSHSLRQGRVVLVFYSLSGCWFGFADELPFPNLKGVGIQNGLCGCEAAERVASNNTTTRRGVHMRRLSKRACPLYSEPGTLKGGMPQTS